MNVEIDKITARAPAWGSSNDRKHLLDVTKVKTRSGVEGILAEFGSRLDGQTQYSINKFYFRNPAGTIIVTCAHVYGDQQTADKFRQMILKQLIFHGADEIGQGERGMRAVADLSLR